MHRAVRLLLLIGVGARLQAWAGAQEDSNQAFRILAGTYDAASADFLGAEARQPVFCQPGLPQLDFSSGMLLEPRESPLPLKEALAAAAPAVTLSFAASGNETVFQQLASGVTYPAGSGGSVRKQARLIETRSTTSQAQAPQYFTRAFVAGFNAPSPSRLAAFLWGPTIGYRMRQWATDFDSEMVPYAQEACPGCKVGRSLLASFQAVTDPAQPRTSILQAWLSQVSPDGQPPEEVLCAGHSLGGSLAVLCGLWAIATFPGVPVTVIASGALKTGNAEFARYYTEILGDNTTMIVYNQDPIPLAPPVEAGFVDTKAPIWIYKVGQGYGNNTATDQPRPAPYAVSVLDHLRGYMFSMRQIPAC